MRTTELFETLEDDHDHDRALQQTGYWGKAGAGCLFGALSTRRFLIAHRSRSVQEPGTWGTWGGAIDRGLTPEQAVRKEVQEESGYHADFRLVPLYVFTDQSFQYSNFLAIVEDEFDPELNWETQGFKWCKYGEWPAPLHPGLARLLKDTKSDQVLRRFAKPPKR